MDINHIITCITALLAVWSIVAIIWAVPVRQIQAQIKLLQEIKPLPLADAEKIVNQLNVNTKDIEELKSSVTKLTAKNGLSK